MSTLEELAQYNIESDIEAMCIIVKHLLTQKEQAMSSTGECAYRGRTEDFFDPDYNELIEEGQFNGLSCAVGCLIKDDYYDRTLENLGIDETGVQEMVQSSHPKWLIDDNSIKMLRVLQRIHDTCNPYIWPLLLDRLVSEVYENFFYQKSEDIQGIIYSIKAAAFDSISNNQIDDLNELIKHKEKMVLKEINKIETSIQKGN